MALKDCYDAIAVHALGAAKAAGGPNFTDVDVGFPVGKGRCVRVYYGGQRESVYFGPGVLSAQLGAESVLVRAYWPQAETATAAQRHYEIEMGDFAKELRTRVNADYTLGGNCIALKVMNDAPAEQVIESDTKYAMIQFEIGIDLDVDYPWSP